MSTSASAHPAKFSQSILEAIEAALHSRLAASARILDPFAGIGGVHALPWSTVGVELEPEWAAQHPATVCGDSTQLVSLFKDARFDAVVTSPAYGNRMADSYAGDAKRSRRFTYRIALGRPLSEGSGAALQWGDAYRQLHREVWSQCSEVLVDGGWMLVNVSNHIRAGVEQPVVEWHMRSLLDLGFMCDEVLAVETPRMRFGANQNRRLPTEKILVMRRSA